ncbi:hypothetical protein Tco_0708602 [Tanacetum coccineum]
MLKNSDQHKKLLDNILLDKLKLDEEIEEGEEEATKEVIRNYKTLREKNDPGVFVIPIRVEGKYDTHALADTGSNINVLPYGIYMQIGADESTQAILDVTAGGIFLYKSANQAFQFLDDKVLFELSDSEKEIFESRDKDGKPIYGPNNLENDSYVSNPLDTLNPFRKICIWKKIVYFLGSLPVPLQNNDWMTKDAESSYIKVEGDGTWHFKCSIVDPERNEYNNVFQTKTTKRKLSKPYKLSDIMATKSKYNTKLNTLLHKKVYAPSIVDWRLLNEMDCGEEIEEMLEIKLCREFYSTFEFNEDVPKEELGSTRLIKFRLLRISSDDDLQLSRSHAAKIKKPVLRDGYANVAWVIAKWMKKKGAGSQRDNMICYDRTTLKELIGSNMRLIPDVPVPGAP